MSRHPVVGKNALRRTPLRRQKVRPPNRITYNLHLLVGREKKGNGCRLSHQRISLPSEATSGEM